MRLQGEGAAEVATVSTSTRPERVVADDAHDRGRHFSGCGSGSVRQLGAGTNPEPGMRARALLSDDAQRWRPCASRHVSLHVAAASSPEIRNPATAIAPYTTTY